MAEQPALKVHLEPDESIEVRELTAALGSLARQYQKMAEQEGLVEKSTDARLLVSSVSHGSIDISLIPDLMVSATLFQAAVERYELILKLADKIKKLVGAFSSSPSKAAEVSVADCEDVINITKPIANHGGKQTIFAVNGDGNVFNVLSINGQQARRLLSNATSQKSLLQDQHSETRQRVPMVWKRLDRDEAKTDGRSSPDKGLIEEVDERSHPVFFTDDMTYLKDEMIGDHENPYQRVYFVDVEVSRIGGKVTSYRVIGFHGAEDLE